MHVNKHHILFLFFFGKLVIPFISVSNLRKETFQSSIGNVLICWGESEKLSMFLILCVGRVITKCYWG